MNTKPFFGMHNARVTSSGIIIPEPLMESYLSKFTNETPQWVILAITDGDGFHKVYAKPTLELLDMNKYVQGVYDTLDADICRPLEERLLCIPPYVKNWIDPRNIGKADVVGQGRHIVFYRLGESQKSHDIRLKREQDKYFQSLNYNP